MKRYARLYAYFLRFSFSRAMEFRLDFFFRVFMDLLYYVVNIAFFKILFLHTPLLVGWNESQVIVFVAGYLVVDALNMTLFSNNLYMLPLLVNKGDLDYYLTRPVSSLFFLSFRDFAANSFVNLLMALGILIWAVSRASIHFSLARAVFYLVLLLAGTALYYNLRMLSILPVFWTHSGRGLDQVFWPLTRFMERPDRIFTGALRFIFVTVLPFAIIASFPARLVLEQFDWRILLHLGLVTGVFFLIVVWCWNWALKSYSSASS